LTNGAGLQRDYELLRRLLESYGHKVNGLMFNDYCCNVPVADVTICLEVINDRQLGKVNWLIPNSEWFFPYWNNLLPRFQKVLCKTKDCYEIWAKKVGGQRCKFIGFESLDLYNPDIGRFPNFLHIAGKSKTKNTEAVCNAWKRFDIPHPLLVIASDPSVFRHVIGCPSSVKWIERLSDTDVARAMNEHLFHIMPSKYEGHGHAIHEALGCYGIVITTDASPMNQINGIARELLIPVTTREKCMEAYLNNVSAEGVAQAVNKAVALSDFDRNRIMDNASRAFLTDRDEFRKLFAEVVNA
jgi:hypothetical protein